MDWYRHASDKLAAASAWTYRAEGETYSEPAALTSLGLLGEGRITEATPSADWLARIQATDGSVGVSEREASPGWPTGLAISVWANWQAASNEQRFTTNIKSAVNWALSNQGQPLPRHSGIGHDTSLRGWAWALNTHAWLEPTAMFVSGLIKSGYKHHGLTLEAIRLILDRQLPQGGFNYGNTAVLGQRLLPRIQPTGIALASLAVAGIDEARVSLSLEYLQQQWPTVNSTASLCYAGIGLTSYGRPPRSLADRLEERYEVWCKRNGSIHKLALLVLAAQKDRCLLARKDLVQDDISMPQ